MKGRNPKITIGGKMKALALKPGTTDLHIAEVEEPKINTPTEVKVKILEVGICGTDREEVSGGRADAPKGESELIIGHEMIGEVIEIGNEVKQFKVGDPVVITVRRGCGQCLPCKNDAYDMCETGLYTERGIKERHGYETEMVIEEEKYLIPVPKAIKHIGVLTEPTTVVEKAIDEACRIQVTRLPGNMEKFAWLKDRNVLVAGLGPIGLLAAMVLRLKGAKVWGLDIVEPNTPRPKILEEMGGVYIKSSDVTIEKFAKSCSQLDMVVEAAGIAKLDFDLIKLLGYNGIYVLTGVPGDERPLNVDGAGLMRQLVLKNQIILGSVNAGIVHFHMAVKDLEEASNKWKGLIETLITSKTSYKEFEKVLKTHPPDEIKSVIEWGES